MTDPKTGSHSITDLLEMTKDLEYFRFYAPSGHSQPETLLCRILVPNKSEVRPLARELKKDLGAQFPQLVLQFNPVEDRAYINVLASSARPWEPLNRDEFAIAAKLEKLLKERMEARGLSLARPETKGNYFEPELYR